MSSQVKALLLYPEFPDTFWSLKHALKFIHRKATLPPLGLLTVAAMLPERWDKRLVDENVRRLGEEDLAWADVVLLSAMMAQRDAARALIARCRAAGKTILAGGPLFTAEHASFPDVDHFILGEAESPAALPAFLADFEKGSARRLYAAEGFPDLRSTPPPLWRLAELRRYASMSVQFSRGCPFDCEFCNITALLGRTPRTKSAAQLIAELDSLRDRGWREAVFFVDDNFIGNKTVLKRELLPALIEWQRRGPSLPFYTEASINLADDAELMRLMHEAGFDTVFIGIETPEEAALAECNKRQNKGRDLLADVRTIQRAGLQVQGGFIVGFDSDTPSIFQRQMQFIQRSGIATAMVGLLNAPPGTRLHDRLRREGRLLGQTSGNNSDGTTNFVPRMDIQALREGYKAILGHIYSPDRYYERVRGFLREYRPPRISSPMTWRHALAFARAAVRLGVLGKERFQYWRLLAWTLLHRPAHFPLAVSLAITGHHFRRTFESLG